MASNDRSARVRAKHGGFIDRFRNSILAYTLSFLAVTSCYYLLWGGIVTVLTSIEKRYSFASWQSGLFMGAAEYGRVVALIPMSYYGGRSHVPRITGISTLLCACVMILIVSPHFILRPSTGFSPSFNSTSGNTSGYSEAFCSPYDAVNHSIEGAEIATESDENQNYVSNMAFVIFTVGFVTLGICASPLTNISVAYIDINASTEKAPFYIGIANSALSFGPMLGAFIAAWAVTIYVDQSGTSMWQPTV